MIIDGGNLDLDLAGILALGLGWTVEYFILNGDHLHGFLRYPSLNPFPSYFPSSTLPKICLSFSPFLLFYHVASGTPLVCINQ